MYSDALSQTRRTNFFSSCSPSLSSLPTLFACVRTQRRRMIICFALGIFFLPRKPFHFSCLRVLLRACVCVCAYSLREGDLCVMCVVRGRKKKSFPVVVIYAALRFSTCARNGTPSHSHTCTQAHIARYATHHNSKVRARKFSDEICDLVRATSK